MRLWLAGHKRTASPACAGRSCKLRRLRWCLSRCLCRCLSRRLCWCRPSGGGFGLRFGAAGSVGTSCFGLFLLPGGLPRRFGSAGAASCAASGAASCASCASGASCSIGSIYYTWSRYNTNDKDDPRSRTTLPSRSVSRKRMCLRVTGPLRAMKCPSSEPVSTMVPTPLFNVILERMSSPRLPWPAGRSAGTRCAPSCGRTQRPAARRKRSSGPACGPR